MPIKYPPRYRYSLFEQWDKKAFEQLKEIAKTKRFPEVIGSFNNKNQFLITLIRIQKAIGIPYEEYERRRKMTESELKIRENQNKDDWRNMLMDILKQVEETNAIDTILLNKKYPPQSISKDIPAWVTYEEDKIVNDFIDDLETKKITFEGTNKEISEFVMRFILGQLGHDWEQTIMMIWEMLGDQNTLNLKELNQEMKNFDYLHLFERN